MPFRYNRLEELNAIAEKHGDDLGVIVMESIRSDHPKEEFINGVRETADKLGAVLIVDEISAGFRYNTGGAHLLFGIKPDIAVFSKALGNGHPIAAVIGKCKIMDAAQRSFISSTYWTERTGPVAGLATIKKHQSLNVGEYLLKIGERIQEIWHETADRYGVQISIGGIPQLSHFSFKHHKSLELKAFFVQEMLDRGFLASTSFYSMYSHKKEHVEMYGKAFAEVIKNIAMIIAEDKVSENLKGKVAASGFSRLT